VLSHQFSAPKQDALSYFEALVTIMHIMTVHTILQTLYTPSIAQLFAVCDHKPHYFLRFCLCLSSTTTP